MPPRARLASPTDEDPPSNRRKTHKFYSLFKNKDGKADLIIRSSDKISFAIQRSLLIAHSSVFEDILSIPQPLLAAGSSPSKVELPVVDVSEKFRSFAFFLRQIVPKAFFVNDLAPAFSDEWDFGEIEMLEEVLEMTEKYDCPMLPNLTARLHLSLLVKAYPLFGWAVAARFGKLEQAKEAIRTLVTSSTSLVGASRYNSLTRTWETGCRDLCLSDLTVESIDRLPAAAIRSFTEVHAKVISSRDGSYTWLNAADEFKL